MPIGIVTSHTAWRAVTAQRTDITGCTKHSASFAWSPPAREHRPESTTRTPRCHLSLVANSILIVARRHQLQIRSINFYTREVHRFSLAISGKTTSPKFKGYWIRHGAPIDRLQILISRNRHGARQAIDSDSTAWRDRRKGPARPPRPSRL